MKIKIITLLGLIFQFAMTAFAQDATIKDTIIKGNGDRIVCVIKTIENDKVQYITGGRFLTTTYLQRLSELKFSDGSTQFIQPIVKINGEEDWEKVIVVTNREKVKNLNPIGYINTEQGGSVFSKQEKLKTKALDNLKHEAAKLGAHIILIVDSSGSQGGIMMEGDRIIGISSGTSITAAAYGF